MNVLELMLCLASLVNIFPMQELCFCLVVAVGRGIFRDLRDDFRAAFFCFNLESRAELVKEVLFDRLTQVEVVTTCIPTQYKYRFLKAVSNEVRLCHSRLPS